MGGVKKKLSHSVLEPFPLKIQLERKKNEQEAHTNKAVAAFIAPELAGMKDIEDISGFEQMPSWDVAVRFQDIKRFGHIPEKEKVKLKRRAIQAILARAQQSLGSVIKPERTFVADLPTFIEKGERGELDVLATLDESLCRGGLTLNAQEDMRCPTSYQDILRFDTRTEKEAHVALVMDASLSMTGEKIALLGVATAVVALCVPSERLSLMGFDSKIRWIKKFGEDLSVEALIDRVLELPAGGFTNLELALKETTRMLSRYRKSQANVILISDGKYTEGNDPAPLAPYFKHLNVLKIGRDQAGRELLLELAAQGNGRFFEARKISDLPRAMYSAMKTLLR